MQPVTLRQKIVIKFINDLTKRDQNGVLSGPTFRELGEALGCRSVRSVVKHCFALKAKGCIESIAKEARTLSLTDKGKRILRDFVKTPEAQEAIVGSIVLGFGVRQKTPKVVVPTFG